MDLVEYNSRMIEVLSDPNTYTIILKNPIKKLSNSEEVIVKNILSG